jgi:hypothetical protein
MLIFEHKLFFDGWKFFENCGKIGEQNYRKFYSENQDFNSKSNSKINSTITKFQMTSF